MGKRNEFSFGKFSKKKQISFCFVLNRKMKKNEPKNKKWTLKKINKSKSIPLFFSSPVETNEWINKCYWWWWCWWWWKNHYWMKPKKRKIWKWCSWVDEERDVMWNFFFYSIEIEFFCFCFHFLCWHFINFFQILPWNDIFSFDNDSRKNRRNFFTRNSI